MSVVRGNIIQKLLFAAKTTYSFLSLRLGVILDHFNTPFPMRNYVNSWTQYDMKNTVDISRDCTNTIKRIKLALRGALAYLYCV